MAFLSIAAGRAHAQTNERLYEGLNFKFVTPGARAVGMGITFVGLADDATAAASNPAGLSNLRRAEVSFEFLGLNTSQTYLVSNLAQGAPCNPPCNVFQTYDHTAWAFPSFASVAVPIGDFTLAGFVNSQQEFSRSFDLSQRFVQAVSTPAGTLPPTMQTAESGSLDVSVRNYGAGGAWALRPWLSLGASVVLSHLDLESQGLNREEDGTLRSRTRTSASVTRPSIFAGVLARPRPRLAVGMGYYRGTTFGMETEVAGTFANPAGSIPPDRCLNQSFRQPTRVCDSQPPLPTDYVVPGRMAVGASYRATPGLTVLGEIAHVRYSTMVTRNFQVIDFRFTNNISRSNFFFEDVNEYHGGLEYRWMRGGHLLALRAGAFSDPGHSLRFLVTAASGADSAQNFEFNTNADRSTGFGKTFGGGLTFGNRLQLDSAVSLVPGSNMFVISLIRRFL